MLQGDSAILLTFIKLPFVVIIFVLSIFEWPLKTGFTEKTMKDIFSNKHCAKFDKVLIKITKMIHRPDIIK